MGFNSMLIAKDLGKCHQVWQINLNFVQISLLATALSDKYSHNIDTESQQLVLLGPCEALIAC